MTGFRSLPAAAFLALPWLIAGVHGPVAQMGAWLGAAAVLAGLLFFRSARAWLLSLMMAATLSLLMALLQYVGWAAEFSPWVAQAERGVMLGNLRQRNQFASLMVIGVLAMLALRPRGRAWLGCAFVLVALLGLGNALSASRTGLLQALALLALAVCWRRSWGANVQWVLGAALLGYGLGALLGPWLAQAAGHANAGLLGRAAASDGHSRLALWSNVIELISQRPILGHGWRSLAYVHYAQDFSSQRFMEMPDNAHNLPLHLAVELGLPIATAFCGLVAWLIWKNKPWNETQPARQLAWGVLLMIGIHSLLEYPLWYGPFFMTALICMGILSQDVWREFKEKWLLEHANTAQDAIKLGVRCFAVLLLAGTAFVAFDYHRVSQIYLQPEQRSSWYAADPLGAAKQTVLFQPQAKFAELQITLLSKETASRILALSSELIHWSPEPRVIEKLIESAVMMGLDELAMFHLQRYREAYPKAHAIWARKAL